MTKITCKIIFINMTNILNKVSMTIKQKKGLFIFLLLLTIVLVVLGVVAAINFSGGVLVVDLSNIAHIQFLKEECSFVSCLFRLMLSLLIFMLVICLCGCKSYLFPIGILFYGYLIYSQAVIFLSLILVYGFFNCVIFALLLLIYILAICFIFILYILEVSCHCNSRPYFKNICNWHDSNVVFCLLCVVLITFIFCLLLTILKSFVLLLVY